MLRKLSLLALVAMFAALIAACGGGAATQPTAAPQAPTEAAATAAPTAAAAATAAPTAAAAATAAPTAAAAATAAPTAAAAATTAATAAAPSGSTGGVLAPAGDPNLSGTVSVLGAFTGAEADNFAAVIAAFNELYPNVEVTYSGINDFDTQIVVRVQAGDAPDIAAFPQPGGAARLAAQGELAPLWPEAIALLDANYPAFWKGLGTFEGTPYGMFHRVNAKGFIWYNKPAFEAAGYTVPTTWDELTQLTTQMQESGIAPWCEGIESGAATGWKGTDWIENIVLRTQPPEVYDRWTQGELAFSSPEIRGAFEFLEGIWFDPNLVYGGTQTIALTNFADAATFLFTDPQNCWLHMQGSFVTNFFPDSVRADIDNQVGVFLMPPIDTSIPPALEVGGDVFVTLAGNDRPEVRAFMEFLGTPAAGAPWAQLGGAIFPYTNQDLSLYPTEIERTVAETILNAEVARFDASDNMTAARNAAFWKGITDWVSGTRTLDEALADIDRAAGQ